MKDEITIIAVKADSVVCADCMFNDIEKLDCDDVNLALAKNGMPCCTDGYRFKILEDY